MTLTGTRSDVPEIFKALDVFVLSSDREGHPLTALEAQSSGTPAVLTNAGGSADAIVRSVATDNNPTELHPNDDQLGKIPRDAAGNPLAAGILVEKSAEAIASALRELLSDDALRRDRCKRLESSKSFTIHQKLTMAYWRRQPSPTLKLHSDQGSQYSSHRCKKFLKTFKITPGTSQRGNLSLIHI